MRRTRSSLGLESLETRNLLSANPLPVLMVIADQHDFYYTEYSATRLSIEAAGVGVQVAATTTNPSYPHANTGEGASSGEVIPDIALASVDADDYSAIVFVGGWGSSMYQYAFEGTYSDGAYNGDVATKATVNELIGEFVAQDKYVAAICHGVTVLAWARVDGVSPLDGKTVSVPYVGSPAVFYQGQYYGYFQLMQYDQVVANGATANLSSGQYGDPTTVADDVVVDGRIITAENYDSASYFGTVVAEEVIAAAGEGLPENTAPIVSNAGWNLIENSGFGTIVGTVTASDADGGQTLSYHIVGGNINNAFTINPATGQITVANAAAIDFETNPVFVLTVEAMDNGLPALASTGQITIQLLDVNEAPSEGLVGLQVGNLIVKGTSGDDTIYTWSGALKNEVYAWINGVFHGPFLLPAGGHVKVFAGNGNDQIYATDLRVSADIYGGAGYDKITGGTADDLLFGEDGNDYIWGNLGNDLIVGGANDDHLDGGEGNDLLLGGDGADYLHGAVGNDMLLGGRGGDYVKGGDGDDVLIGGTTTYDSNSTALMTLFSTWTGPMTFADRVSRLQRDLVAGQTVLEDQATDVMCTGLGSDLMFGTLLDALYSDAEDCVVR